MTSSDTGQGTKPLRTPQSPRRMNFLGIGPMELLLIVVLALIVLGPEKLPEFMAAVGKAYSEIRRATTQVSDEFNRTLQAELGEGRAIIRESKEMLSDARSTVNEAVADTRAAIRTDPKPPPAVGPPTGSIGAGVTANRALDGPFEPDTEPNHDALESGQQPTETIRQSA